MRPSVIRERFVIVAALAVTLAACGHDSSDPTPLPCTYSVATTPSSFGPAGGSGSATVTTATGCTWTARADAQWLTITSGASGSGAGAVSFTVAANTDQASRNSSLTIGGQTARIDQEGAPVNCTYSISPTSASIGKDGGPGSFAVTTGATCTWSASSDAPWLAVTTGTGTGNGSISYSVSRNDQTSSRSATIRVAGQVFTLTQAGDAGACTYSVTPVEFAPCMGATELTSQIVTAAGCSWSVTSDSSWLTVTSGSTGAGSGSVRFRVTDNWAPPRTGLVMVRWPTPTAGQNLRVAQAGCYYAVSRDTFSIGASGGSANFDVIQQSEPYTCGGPLQNACMWSAVSDSSWITVTSSMPRFGDDRVSFTVAPNATGAARSGTITVRDKVVRITQGT